jgi:hypothetical protein
MTLFFCQASFLTLSPQASYRVPSLVGWLFGCLVRALPIKNREFQREAPQAKTCGARIELRPLPGPREQTKLNPTESAMLSKGTNRRVSTGSPVSEYCTENHFATKSRKALASKIGLGGRNLRRSLMINRLESRLRSLEESEMAFSAGIDADVISLLRSDPRLCFWLQQTLAQAERLPDITELPTLDEPLPTDPEQIDVLLETHIRSSVGVRRWFKGLLAAVEWSVN